MEPYEAKLVKEFLNNINQKNQWEDEALLYKTQKMPCNYLFILRNFGYFLKIINIKGQ